MDQALLSTCDIADAIAPPFTPVHSTAPLVGPTPSNALIVNRGAPQQMLAVSASSTGADEEKQSRGVWSRDIVRRTLPIWRTRNAGRVRFAHCAANPQTACLSALPTQRGARKRGTSSCNLESLATFIQYCRNIMYQVPLAQAGTR
jgi:hypothetical protein